MSNLEPRDELASIAASLRAYLECHVDSGSSDSVIGGSATGAA